MPFPKLKGKEDKTMKFFGKKKSDNDGDEKSFNSSNKKKDKKSLRPTDSGMKKIFGKMK